MSPNLIRYLVSFSIWFGASNLYAHPNHLHSTKHHPADPFRQLEEVWPTPDELRLASGAPGPKYWQQKVDYQIDVELNDVNRSLNGKALITYHNQSPHPLEYLWLQLDQNRFKASSASHLTKTFKGKDKVYFGQLSGPRNVRRRVPGVQVKAVYHSKNEPLATKVIDTMMRVKLPKVLQSGAAFKFTVEWSVNLLRHKDTWARSGYEDLKSLTELDEAVKAAKAKLEAPAKPNNKPSDQKDNETESPDELKKKPTIKTVAELSEPSKPQSKVGNKESVLPKSFEAKQEQADSNQIEREGTVPTRRIYEIAQWYPRLAAYTDVTGWQNKQFLGNGEFTLEFGEFLVRITAPDHLTLTATGELMNPAEVLTMTQRKRLEDSNVAETPQYIISPEEARQQSLQQPKGTKTWIFGASQVRDFAFAASNTFIWDAMAYRPEGRDSVMAMSFYPLEAQALWKRYSTHTVIHALEQYERFTFPYPYPVAISVNGPVFGMEYPMITFNGVRPKLDGTYSKGAKYALIGVIIHEVGHFFFPMIVNSDERQWTWLDEGINSFLQYQAERAWEKDYPSWNGAPDKMITYMTSKDQMPIMTNSESLIQFGPNAYGKPATALSVLRETVMGPELFDEAFRAYAKRWRFKRPMPSDFFRTLEDVSGVDLDWFWNAWFYSTAHVDIQIKDLRRLRLKTKDPKQDKAVDRMRHEAKAKYIAEIRDEGRSFRVKNYPELADFYNRFDPHVATESEIEQAKKAKEALKKEHPDRVKELEIKAYFYELSLVNKGGVVTPLPLLLRYANKQSEMRYIPAEVWRKNAKEVKILLDLESELISVEFDPFHETGDAHKEDNVFPQRISDTDSFDLKTWRRPQSLNPMQKHRKWRAKKKAEAKAIQEVKVEAESETRSEERSKTEVRSSLKEKDKNQTELKPSFKVNAESNSKTKPKNELGPKPKLKVAPKLDTNSDKTKNK